FSQLIDCTTRITQTMNRKKAIPAVHRKIFKQPSFFGDGEGGVGWSVISATDSSRASIHRNQRSIVFVGWAPPTKFARGNAENGGRSPTVHFGFVKAEPARASPN